MHPKSLIDSLLSLGKNLKWPALIGVAAGLIGSVTYYYFTKYPRQKVIARDVKRIGHDWEIFQFGKVGMNPGEFNMPNGLCVSDQGEVIVVENLGNRVQIFDAEGRFLLKFGGQGLRPGQFRLPNGIAIDKDDKIYVADSSNHRIQIFQKSGKGDNLRITYLKTLGTGKAGNADGQFNYPTGVCINERDGTIHVADMNNHRVQIFDKESNFLRKFGKKGSGMAEMNQPSGIALTSQGEIVVTEVAGARIHIFDHQGNHVRLIREKNDPAHLVVVKNAERKADDIYVTCSKNHVIKVYASESGEQLHEFGGAEKLFVPVGIGINQKTRRIYVASSLKHEIVVF